MPGKEWIKLLKHSEQRLQKLEQAKVTIRHWREKAWEEIQEGFKKGEIREDDKFKGKDELQKLIDDYNEKIDQLGTKKEKEIFE